jgi:hypothetical protein
MFVRMPVCARYFHRYFNDEHREEADSHLRQVALTIRFRPPGTSNGI